MRFFFGAVGNITIVSFHTRNYSILYNIRHLKISDRLFSLWFNCTVKFVRFSNLFELIAVFECVFLRKPSAIILQRHSHCRLTLGDSSSGGTSKDLTRESMRWSGHTTSVILRRIAAGSRVFVFDKIWRKLTRRSFCFSKFCNNIEKISEFTNIFRVP